MGRFRVVYIAMLLFLVLSACDTKEKRAKLLQQYNKGNTEEKAAAIKDMGETNDTFYVRFLMQNLNDPRVSLAGTSYGCILVNLKLKALHDITGWGPNSENTRNWPIDTTAVKFWKDKFPEFYSEYK